ncbi:traB domain-containing protein isoform X4 [Marmota marmota marmota]|uniref:traB domain-containing protein isoform X4 n=1 Tax=Marmota marmota marmota TaxID=9994 RepID=UPI002093F90F|nr:traB domain-containing protein isoform X4 [Marmota marmota marmota]
MEVEEQPPQEADGEPVLTSGASGSVPRVLSGEPQNLSDVDAFNLLLEMKLKRRREQPNLPRTVTQLVAEDGSRVYVVGTAHFSDDSKRDVVKTIREVQPDVVVVELCQYRVSMLKMDERTLLREAQEVSLEKLQQAVRQNGLMSGLMQMLLLKVSAHITEQLGMAPGGEFREAFKEASKVPFCKFHLGDRPIPVTFKRAIAALSFWQKVKLAWGLCFLSDPISRASEVCPFRGRGRRGHGPCARHREELEHRPQHPGDHDHPPAVHLGQSVQAGLEGRLLRPAGLRPVLDGPPHREPGPVAARDAVLPPEGV